MGTTIRPSPENNTAMNSAKQSSFLIKFDEILKDCCASDERPTKPREMTRRNPKQFRVISHGFVDYLSPSFIVS
jgi:hypothetical protein